MSDYDPSSGATPTGRNATALLVSRRTVSLVEYPTNISQSQRDLSIHVPVNFVGQPGVALTAACFENHTYADSAAAKCFSNLLAVGFRKFELDLYWDVTRRIWSFCPVQLGDANALFNVSTSSPLLASQTSTASLSSGQLTGRGDDDAVPSTGSVFQRQASGSLLSASSSASTTAESLQSVSTTATLTSVSNSSAVVTGISSGAPSPTSAAGTLIQIGQYSCTDATNLDLFTSVLSAHLEATETNLNATTKYMILNLHAAASASNPGGSARQPSMDALPSNGNLLSSVVNTNLSIYLYTPSRLSQQRANLNMSAGWFDVPLGEQPDSAYFETTGVGGHSATQDGWPSESYIEIGQAMRLLVGFGQVDPQMSSYNFSGDAATIFPPGYLQSPRELTFDGATITNGCFFNAGVDSLDMVNSSWATFSLESGQADAADLEASSLTNCGVSPVLNESLSVTADQAFEPYQAYVLSTIWSWGPHEPSNSSNSTQATSDANVRCAALNSTSGRWQAADCNGNHYGACRVASQPYQWRISDATKTYEKVSCQGNATFDVPQTALENQYALEAWRKYTTQSDPDDALLWLNFNSLDAQTCWVVGQNATCPYLPGESKGQVRQVVVPVVAAVLIFTVSVLVILTKCAANRRTSKRRRRRGDDGGDYEGVPS